ncbi:hypothetical protein FSP39_000628 [Pinctada imbricata]|uniref:Peroxidase n=1 Tax=Pinctada imbricata TaxID=66713 RepID=A0AA88Y4W7_PINIB|nr:hypothetical protein FSP39_000628 [Pinctada imbricata]
MMPSMIFLFAASLLCIDGATESRSKRAVPFVNKVPIADLIKHSIDVAASELKQKKILEESFYKKGTDVILNHGNHMWHHSQFMAVQDPTKFEQLNHKAYIVLRAIKEFEKTSGMLLSDLKKKPGLINIWRQLIAPHCQCPKPTCNPTDRYRTSDGTCNNLHRPKWGASNTPQARFLAAAYYDGLNKPRAFSETGHALPSAREVSNCIHNSEKSTFISNHLTIMFMTWGQFVDHDFSGTPITKGFNNSDIRCCHLDEGSKDLRGSCFPIPIPKDDPHFRYSCMNFIRSAAAPNEDCEPEWRNPINQHTSYIDASNVYGATKETAHDLRAYHGGFLKMFERGMLPKSEKVKCMKEMKNDYCFAAGDDRSMVVPSLSYVHTLFVREHNRLASKLALLNPHWDDERIYQESRKIVSALMQQITYVEYLPLVLGKECLEKNQIMIKSPDFDTVYDPTEDASTANVFSTAAFRFGHSQIPNHQAIAGKDGIIRGVLPIEKTFNRPSFMLQNNGLGYDGVGNWVVNDVQAKDDRFLDDGVRNKLFLDDKGRSFDLSALNIQRGRDHGLPSYNSWRLICGLPTAKHFGIGPGGLVDIDAEAAVKFRKLYRHTDDIDLFPAAMSERKIPGSLVGPTFACILAKQFRKYRLGDRFWYENNFNEIGFTKDQLIQIKKMRLSSVMCANTRIRSIQFGAFQVPSMHNPRMPCELLPQIDLRYWQDGGHSGKVIPGLYDTRNLSRVPLNPVQFWTASTYKDFMKDRMGSPTRLGRKRNEKFVSSTNET